MKNNLLVLTTDGKTYHCPLNKERLILGRDKDCDIFVDNPSISRHHVALTYRHEHLYIENISSTGRIYINNNIVEFAELVGKEKIKIGNLEFTWSIEEKKSSTAARATYQTLGDPTQLSKDPFDPLELVQNEPNHFLETKNNRLDQGSDIDLMPANLAPTEQPDPNIGNEISHSGETQAQGISAVPQLILKRGELLQKEFSLDRGSAWTIGSSPSAHIRIDHPDVANEHAMVERQGNHFHIHALGSAAVQVNGIRQSHVQLKVFDAITLGESQSVELQFVIADPALRANSPTPPALQNQINETLDQEPTLLHAPGIYTPPKDQFYTQTEQSNQNQFHQTIKTDKAKPSNLIARFRSLPKRTQALAVGLAFILFAAAVMQSNLFKTNSNIAKSSADPLDSLLPEERGPNQISPEFKNLPEDKKNEIRALYKRAADARDAEDWKTAFETSKSIKSLVGYYRDALDILDTAQRRLAEASSNALINAGTAAEDIDALVEKGIQALKEQRWTEAENYCVSALNLDPTHDRANECFVSAQARAFEDPDARAPTAVAEEAPTVVAEELPKVESEESILEREMLEIKQFREQYKQAQNHINNGKFGQALRELKLLRDRLSIHREITLGGRLPASVSQRIQNESHDIAKKVQEAMDVTHSQLESLFQSQLVDAEQFEMNQQYAQARIIYDRILKEAPDFDKALELRERLYSKLITMGRSKYQEALIYQSVGRLDLARDGFRKSADLLASVNDPVAANYHARAQNKLKELGP